jgi:multidrug efflux pump subunit AcrA (membrane-fusion protein)
VQISDADIVQVAVGAKARIYQDSQPDRPYAGTVSYIASTPTVAGKARIYLVRAILDNPAGLHIGMNARVELPTR